MENHYWTLDTGRIQSLLIEKELKRWWVAEVAGIHRTTLRRWLSGRIAKVQGEHVHSLAGVLCVTAREIARPLGNGGA